MTIVIAMMVIRARQNAQEWWAPGVRYVHPKPAGVLATFCRNAMLERSG